MSRTTKPILILGACIALFLGSFSDEAAQVTFALHLASHSASAATKMSALLVAGLLGGISASLIATRVLVRFVAKKLLAGIFVVETVLIAVASFVNTLPAFLLIAFMLGCLGSLLWSSVLVILPTLNMGEAGIARANRLVQSVRNLGYVVGPLLGSLLFAWSSGTRGLLALVLFTLFAAVAMRGALPGLVRADAASDTPKPEQKKNMDLRGFIHTPGVLRALWPLIITVLVTSTLNVLLIVRVRNEIGLSAQDYGLIVAALSTGLVIGPILLAGWIGKLGDAAGASLSAAIIGLGIVAVGFLHPVWMLMAATLCIGIANGIQNTLMAGFMMKRIDPDKRPFQMPAYILCLQVTVVTGYAIAAFMHVNEAGIALMISGAIAALTGLVGVMVNWSNKPLVGN